MRDHAALVAFLIDRMRAPLAWGRQANDCVSFAAGAALAQTGRDFLEDAPTWSTELGARKVLARLGGLEAAVDARLRSIAPAKAQRGDIALVEQASGPGLMVVEGDSLIGPGAAGAVRRPRADMLRAWSLD